MPLEDDPAAPACHHRKLTCTCTLIPEARWNEFLQVPGVTPQMLQQMRDIAARPSPRALKRLSAPDADGHRHYLGKLPPDRAQPRVLLNGERIDLIVWVKLSLGEMADPSWEYQRICGVFDCFAADHWVVHMPDTKPKPARTQDFVSPVLLEVWDENNPQPVFRLHAWDEVTDTCLAYGHRINIHGAYTRKSAYCPGCYKLWQTWKRERRDYLLHLGDVARGAPMRPEESAVLARNAERAIAASASEPSLADLIARYPTP